MTDLEAAAASAAQWQEAYGQLQQQLQAAQVGYAGFASMCLIAGKFMDVRTIGTDQEEEA